MKIDIRETTHWTNQTRAAWMDGYSGYNLGTRTRILLTIIKTPALG